MMDYFLSTLGIAPRDVNQEKIPKMLRTFKIRASSRYYRQKLMPVRSYGEGTVSMSGEKYFYQIHDEIIELPTYAGITLRYNKLYPTAIIGPYICWNKFEETKEAQVLYQSAKTLYPSRALIQKLVPILETYSEWITELPEKVTFRHQLKQDATQRWSGISI